MTTIPTSRRRPAVPHLSCGEDVNPVCGHPDTDWCAGCDACMTCDGECYCSTGTPVADEPAYLLAS
jgi:hypothetical protein